MTSITTPRIPGLARQSRLAETAARHRHSPHRGGVRWLAAACLLLSAAAGASPIQPPLHVLFDPLNVLVSATLVEADPSGRLLFQRNEILHAEPTAAPVPESIELMAPAWIVADLAAGDRYLVGYTPYARHPQKVRSMMVSSGGARVLMGPGIEPALFPDVAVYRELFAWAEGGRIGDRPDALAMMLDALDQDEAPLRALAAGQLAYDPKLVLALDRPATRKLRTSIEDPTLSWPARAALFDLAVRRSDLFGTRWLRRTSEKILATAPLTGYGESVNPGQLVIAAFEFADVDGGKVRDDALVRWLASDSTPLAERALLLMRRQDAGLEQRSLEAALGDAELLPVSRRFLEDHRRRLAILRSRQILD